MPPRLRLALGELFEDHVHLAAGQLSSHRGRALRTNSVETTAKREHTLPPAPQSR